MEGTILNSNIFLNKLRDHIYLQLSAIFMIVFKINFTKKLGIKNYLLMKVKIMKNN